ncbi:MAG: exosortase system-associated protein, TIGR04073 family [Candidatus Omnitrophica bacterium]|nr:exosortase system-associated protein, TIGR04073 family [Candidatus Omnitrophota bacterium]
MKKFLGLFIIFFLVAATVAFAAEKGQYPDGPVQKLERGVGNTLFGWTEIPKRIVDQTKASNPIKGVLLGTFHGTCRAFARTTSGAMDIVTFPISGYDKPMVNPDMPKAE